MTAAYEVPDRAVRPLAAFLWGKPLGPEYPGMTDASVAARELLAEPVRISVAEELRVLAKKYKADADKERNRSIRLEASGPPKWQHEASIASAQELMAFVRDLHTRANELDPEGAQR